MPQEQPDQPSAEILAGQIIVEQDRARRHHSLADGLTNLRKWSGIPIGISHFIFGHNWITFGAASFSAGTDGLDGHEARKGIAITDRLGLPRITSNADDPEADRALVDSLSVAQVLRDVLDGEYETAALKSAAFIVNKVRDDKMAKLRAEASDQGKNVDAIKINKMKTATILSGVLLGLTPEARKRKSVNYISTALYAGGVAVGVVGYNKFKSHLEAQDTQVQTN